MSLMLAKGLVHVQQEQGQLSKWELSVEKDRDQITFGKKVVDYKVYTARHVQKNKTQNSQRQICD